MKKLSVLFLLIVVMHNSMAMDQDQDEKCLLVARYLNKYPDGRDVSEKQAIHDFFGSSFPERQLLSQKVKEYRIKIAKSLVSGTNLSSPVLLGQILGVGVHLLRIYSYFMMDLYLTWKNPIDRALGEGGLTIPYQVKHLRKKSIA